MESEEEEEDGPSVAEREEQPARVDLTPHLERMLRTLMDAFPDYDFEKTLLGKQAASEQP